MRNHLREWREARGLTLEEIAEAVNSQKSTISKLERGERRITADWLGRIAKAYKVKPEDLMRPPPISGHLTATLAPAMLAATGASGARLRPIPVMGYVQAGLWREALEWPPEDRYELPLPVPAGFQGLSVIALEVRGPSMDLAYRHGSIVVCVPFIEIGRNPRSGERVVALRSNGAGAWEATVKEFRLDKDGNARLWPLSSHPDFQAPILAEPDNGEDLVIQYLVIGSYVPEA